MQCFFMKRPNAWDSHPDLGSQKSVIGYGCYCSQLIIRSPFAPEIRIWSSGIGSAALLSQLAHSPHTDRLISGVGLLPTEEVHGMDRSHYLSLSSINRLLALELGNIRLSDPKPNPLLPFTRSRTGMT